jgi:tetratricopeptide (TPR) repeat protein
MSSRKFVIAGLVIGLAVGVWPGLAQEQAQPEATQPAAQGDLVPIVVGLDLFERAGTAYDAGDYETAVKDYSLFLLLNPTFSQAYYMRGMAYSRLDQFDQALDDLNQALVYPQSSEQITGLIYNDRALIYMLQDDAEAALEDLDAAITAAPDLPDAYLRRAQIYLFEERYEEALVDYDKLIELAPEFSQGYAGRAVTNISLGNLDAALVDYDRLIELEPENAGAYASRSIIHAQEANYDAALADLNAAIRLQPNDPSLYLQRGAIHSILESHLDAAADYLEWIRRQETREVQGDRLQPGESVVVAMENGVSYYLPFMAKAGQTITLSASARPETSTDPLMVLLDTEGQPVYADDDSGDNFDAAINGYVVEADGLYMLIVSHAGGNPDGPVRVLLEVE